MPRARRRRHRAVAKRGWGRLLLLTLLGALGVVLVVGSDLDGMMNAFDRVVGVYQENTIPRHGLGVGTKRL